MRLDGIHHVTCITGNAPGNVSFYAGTLGLRMVKKTVNQDDPTVYHLFYADERGSPGADITFFEYPGARRGAAGDGMVHTVSWRVASEAALDFWEKRLAGEGVASTRSDGSLTFADPEGLRLELVVRASSDAPLVAEHPEIPAAVAFQGFDGVRAFASAPERSSAVLESTLGFAPVGSDAWEVRGDTRGGLYGYDAPPADRGMGGAGTVHHVAFSSQTAEHEAWWQAVVGAGLHPSPIIDRFWFKSIYFKEPGGALFEIATDGPGFAVDEDPEALGEQLVLPPFLEPHRDEIEKRLARLTMPVLDESAV
jgi:glyoxalase family protein